MEDINIEPNENGIKIKCAKVSVLLALKYEDPLTEPELKQRASRRNYNNSLVLGGSRQSQIPRNFNHILSRCISKEYIKKHNILSNLTLYEITSDGEEYVDSLFKEVLEYI